MKKTTHLLLALFALFALNACGEVEDELNSDTDNSSITKVNEDTDNFSITSVDILNLDDGYVIDGYNSQDENVRLIYCGTGYDYSRASLSFSGTFNINSTQSIINMFDNGGSYIINTGNGYLEVGENYDIYDVKYDITVEAIFETAC